MKSLIAVILSLSSASLAIAFPAGSDTFSQAPALLNVSNDSSADTNFVSYTAQPNEAGILWATPVRSAWWTWRPEADGLAIIEVLPPRGRAPADMQVLGGVFTGLSVSNLTPLAGGIGSLRDGGVRLYVPVSVSTTYHIKADSGAALGAVALRIRLIPRTVQSYSGVYSSSTLGKNFMVQVTRLASGAFTAQVRTPGAKGSHRGKMNAFGTAYLPLPGSSFEAPGFVEVDFAGIGELPCMIETSGERLTLKLSPQQILTPQSPTPTAGYYTAAVDMVVATGFFTGRISATGSVRFSGRMPDGTPFVVSSRLLRSLAGAHIVPLFVSLHRGKGVLALIASVQNTAPNSLSPMGGYYLRPPVPGAVFLPSGLALSVTNLYRGRYTPPQPGQRAMNFRQSSNGAGLLSLNPWGMELANQIQENFNFGTNNKFTFSSQSRKPALVLNVKTGLVTGSITAPENVKRRISAVLTGGSAPFVGLCDRLDHDVANHWLSVEASCSEPFTSQLT